MPYKNKEKTKENYYKNRDKRIAYQREYDKAHKEQKRLQDQKRYGTERYNLISKVRRHTIKFFPELLKRNNGCQICGLNQDIHKLEIHHVKYTGKIEDCLLLCQECHKKIHRKVI